MGPHRRCRGGGAELLPRQAPSRGPMRQSTNSMIAGMSPPQTARQ